MVAAFVAAGWFILSGWMTLVWKDRSNVIEPGVWVAAKGDDRVDDRGNKRNRVFSAVVEPGETIWFYNQNLRCGNAYANVVLWEANRGTQSVSVQAAVSPKYGGRYTNTNVRSAQSYCGSARYAFRSNVRQVIRLVPVIYNTRDRLPAGNGYSDRLCVSTRNGTTCMNRMATLTSLQNKRTASIGRMIRDFALGFGLLAFALATRFGYFRVYTIFFPSKSARRAADNLAAGRDVDVRNLADPLDTDFKRRQRTEDLEGLVKQARSQANELEKKHNETVAKARAEEGKILDELEEATKRVAEITKKMTKGKD